MYNLKPYPPEPTELERQFILVTKPVPNRLNTIINEMDQEHLSVELAKQMLEHIIKIELALYNTGAHKKALDEAMNVPTSVVIKEE